MDLKFQCFLLSFLCLSYASPQFFGNRPQQQNRFAPPQQRQPTQQFKPQAQGNFQQKITFQQPSRQPTFKQQPSFVRQPQQARGPGAVVYEGKTYILTWREGQSSFTGADAERHCQSRGMRMISLDNPQKIQHFFGLLESDNAPYFWAGATKTGNTLIWANGRTEVIQPGQFPWSNTGSHGTVQPDGGEKEKCLAVLNNYYKDGVKFHDVSCPHKKPTICEA